MASATPRRPPRKYSRTFTEADLEIEGQGDSTSLLNRLMNMGFSQNRSEKAIATTGSVSEENIGDCVNWLLAHVDDLSLDSESSREYIIYMCPASGPLCDMLNKFWSDTQAQALNGAHESFPHIRLTTFTKVDDGLMPKLIQCIEYTLNTSESVKSGYELEYQSLTDTAYKYVGLFLSDADDSKLHNLTDEISVNASKLGITIEPYVRHMHMSLAYRFSDAHQHKIEELASAIDTTAKCNWELRLYSRDTRISAHELREVTHEYIAQQPDEINLVIGDTILTLPDSVQNSIDGWFTGFSLRNGLIGVYPGNYTVKTALEHKSWTLVKGLPLVAHNKLEKVQLYENITFFSESESTNTEEAVGQDLSLLFIRHAERIDAVMGKDWVKNCFEDSGKDKFLKRFNLNMPDKYVKRRSINDFDRDTPITEIGRFQSKLIGKAIEASSSLHITAIYSSPSLRCIETADVVAKCIPKEKRPLIRIENCLFEWNRWHPILPTFIPAADLKEQGFDIDMTYKSEMLAFDMMETLDAYYERSYKFCQSVIDRHNRAGGCVLLFAHAATPEVCIRKLSKRQPLPQREFISLINKVPFCEPILACQGENGVWKAVTPPIPKLWHLDNKKFDMKFLTNNPFS